MAKIAIIGAGGWGTAVGMMQARHGHDVVMWTRNPQTAQKLQTERENKRLLPGAIFPENLQVTAELSCCQGQEVLVMAVPSVGVRQTARLMRPYIKPGQILVNISKGLEEGTLERLSQVICEELPDIRFAAMSGPSHAEEVVRSLPTTNVVGCADRELGEYVQNLFMNETFRVYTTTDIIGMEIGASLKNVIAICAGVVDGMGFGDNTKAALMTRGIAEIARIGVKMGADVQTFAGLSGIGDLIVTCTSMHSRNRRAGILIGQGKSAQEAIREVGMVVEGYTTTKAAYDLAQKVGVEMPIVNETYRVLYEGKSPRQAIVDLMTREKRDEGDTWV